MTKIKICGLRTLEDVEAVNEFCPEYIGFIFAQGRKRYIEPEKAMELKKALKAGINAVGVFVNEDIDVVAKIANDGIIDVIQLHGSEDNDYITALREKADKVIVKAIRMETAEDLETARNCIANIVLFDCGAGGTGETFDWSLIENYDRPFFLAGGLNPQNVSDALKLEPNGVDVSSGVETDGKKDKQKIEAFIKQVRSGGEQ